MSIDTRDALNRLIAALEHHHDLAQNADIMQEAALEETEDRLRDAFFTYDDVLFTQFGVELPFEMLDDDDEDEDDDDDDELDILFADEDEDHDSVE